MNTTAKLKLAGVRCTVWPQKATKSVARGNLRVAQKFAPQTHPRYDESSVNFLLPPPAQSETDKLRIVRTRPR